jgi:acetoacetyl-CoA synthetase
VITGRSDATLNPGGVRIGTADLYRVVEQMPEIQDSLVIGQDWEDDVRVVLFVQPADGVELDDELVGRIRAELKRSASPRHVPAVVLAVPAVPYTISGKKVELAVREIVHGRPVKNRDALKNPEVLEAYADRPELQS